MKYFIKKQFGFQKGHSTEQAIIQLIDHINNSFEKNHFKKAFDTVDYSILIKKLKLYGIKGNSLRCLRVTTGWLQGRLSLSSFRGR